MHSYIKILFLFSVQEKKEEFRPSPMTKAPSPTEKFKKATRQHKNVNKTSITQWLRDDLGRSVEVTAVTPLVWLNGVYERSTFPLTAKVV